MTLEKSQLLPERTIREDSVAREGHWSRETCAYSDSMWMWIGTWELRHEYVSDKQLIDGEGSWS